jgi:hypothetical protein
VGDDLAVALGTDVVQDCSVQKPKPLPGRGRPQVEPNLQRLFRSLEILVFWVEGGLVQKLLLGACRGPGKRLLLVARGFLEKGVGFS